MFQATLQKQSTLPYAQIGSKLITTTWWYFLERKLPYSKLLISHIPKELSLDFQFYAPIPSSLGSYAHSPLRLGVRSDSTTMIPGLEAIFRL